MPLPETIRVHVTLIALEKGDPRRIGPYRLRARAGVGGMGVVYLGIGPRDGRVAVKVLRRELAESPQFRSRFVREIAAAARVDAACTARFVSADATSTQPWFATEYIRGPSLEAFVAEHGALPATAVRAFAVGVADALAAIGRARLVHRDLKPTNVLLTRSGPRVIDFGIALEDDDTAPFTELDEPTGTVGWMAPEQVREGCSTPATDVFAWGALVAYAASGTPPFGVGDTDTVLHRVLYAEPVLQALQPDLEPVVRTALSKDPAARPSTEQLLRTLLHAPPGTGRRALSERVDALLAATWRVGVLPGEETLPRRSTPRRRLAAAAAGVAVIAGTMAAVATLVGGTSHAHPVAVSTATTAATTSTSTSTTTSTTTTTTTATTTTTVPPTTTTVPTMPDPNAALLRDQAMVQQLGYLTYASPIGFYTGSPLAAILGNRNGAAYGAAGRVFFFVGGTRYVSGGPTDDSNSMFLVTAADTTISVSYTLYDPGSDAPVGQQIVRYHWTGTRITALDPIPTSDPNEPRSRR